MILSLWFWGQKINGRRALISVGGVFPLLLIFIGLILPLFASLR